MTKLVVDDYNDLLNLHKALMEAKFHNDPENDCIAGSPVIARIMNQIVDIISECGSDSWKKWRNIKNHRLEEERHEYIGVWHKMIIAASRNCIWKEVSHQEKINISKIYLSPFYYDNQDLEDFINQVDALLIKN